MRLKITCCKENKQNLSKSKEIAEGRKCSTLGKTTVETLIIWSHTSHGSSFHEKSSLLPSHQ